MEGNTSLPYLNRGRFTDFDHFKEATRGWDLDWRQLDRGPLNASMSQVATRFALVTHSAFNRAFDQRGASPPGAWTFGLIERGVSSVRWCGQPLADDQVNVFERTGGFDAISGSHFDVHTVTLSEALVAEVCETLAAPGLDRILADGVPKVTTCDPGDVKELRRALRRVHEVVAEAPAQGALPGLRDELESEIPVRLLRVLASGARGEASPPSFGTRQLAIQRALPFIEAHRDALLTVPDVCRAVRLSRRTLEYAFKEHFGVTPKAYLMAIRLGDVRRELVPNDPPTKVADVANRWGFWHMGQFAADYRRQFGELPSETLRRRDGVRA